jgi:hypothetical protein
MGHDSTAMVIIDPFDSGERLGEAKDRQLLAVALFPAAKHSPEGAIHLVFTSWRQLHAVLSAGDVVYGEPKDLAVWVKAKQPQGLLHSSQHELIFVFENGDGANRKRRRRRSDAWNHVGENISQSGASRGVFGHSNVKPVALVTAAMRQFSRRARLSSTRSRGAARRFWRPTPTR